MNQPQTSYTIRPLTLFIVHYVCYWGVCFTYTAAQVRNFCRMPEVLFLTVEVMYAA